MIAKASAEHRERGQEHAKAQQHHVAHIARLRRAGEDAVELEAPDPAQWPQRRPDEIRQCCRLYRLALCAEGDDTSARKPQNRRHKNSEHDRPDRRELDCSPKAGAILGADRPPDKGFRRESKAVQQIDDDRLHIDQQRIGRERHVACRRTLRREQHQRRVVRERAHHDVGIDRECTAELRCVDGIRQRRCSAETSCQLQGDAKSSDRRQHLGNERCPSHASDPAAEFQREQNREQHVADVQEQLQHEGDVGAPKSDEPTEQRKIDEPGWCRPDPDVVVEVPCGLHLRRASRQPEAECPDRRLERYQDNAADNRNHQRAQQMPGDLTVVSSTQRLCGKPRRTHAQEAERPIEHAENDGPDRNGAHQMRVAELPDHDRVDEADHRHGCVGQHDRHGDLQQIGMRQRLACARPHARPLAAHPAVTPADPRPTLTYRSRHGCRSPRPLPKTPNTRVRSQIGTTTTAPRTR